MDQIKGVLKDPLKVMQVPKADRNKYEKDEPPMQLSKDDVNTWEELQAKVQGVRCLVTPKKNAH
jgi:hypothetical protein